MGRINLADLSTLLLSAAITLSACGHAPAPEPVSRPSKLPEIRDRVDRGDSVQVDRPRHDCFRGRPAIVLGVYSPDESQLRVLLDGELRVDHWRPISRRELTGHACKVSRDDAFSAAHAQPVADYDTADGSRP